MKTGLTRLMIGLAVLAAPVAAHAYSFNLAGSYHFEDGNATTFAETLVFDSAFVVVTDPTPDAVIGFPDTATMGPLYLDESSYTSGVSYGFAPTDYPGGFFLDAGGGVTLTADLSMEPLHVSGSTASSNASLVLNLTNITAGGYTAGSSEIIDQLLSGRGAAINFTLNTANLGGFAAVIDGGGGSGSFSASVVHIPEPGTVVLMGAGLLGLAWWDRRRAKAKRNA